MSNMSTSKLDTSGIFQLLKVDQNQTRLTLPADSVCIRKNGIEFQSHRPIPVWREMTVDLYTSFESKKIHCTGVIVACTGNRNMGYSVSMVFTNLSKAAQERLDLLAFSEAI